MQTELLFLLASGSVSVVTICLQLSWPRCCHCNSNRPLSIVKIQRFFFNREDWILLLSTTFGLHLCSFRGGNSVNCVILTDAPDVMYCSFISTDRDNNMEVSALQAWREWETFNPGKQQRQKTADHPNSCVTHAAALSAYVHHLLPQTEGSSSPSWIALPSSGDGSS